jgi:hypothetical protein
MMHVDQKIGINANGHKSGVNKLSEIILITI